MTIVLANESKAVLIDLERTYLNGCRIRLYTVNYVPVAGMLLTSFQPYPTDTGLAVVKTPVFGPATLNATFQGELLAPSLTWTTAFDGGTQTVYGYVVYDPVSLKVVFAERASAPFTITGPGQPYIVVPRKVMDTL